MWGAQNGVQKLLRGVYLFNNFVHCSSHQHNLVMQVCSNITLTWVIFANFSAHSFFFSLSSKRTDLLKEVCGPRLPHPSQTRCNFQSRAVNSVYQNKKALLECVWNNSTQLWMRFIVDKRIEWIDNISGGWRISLFHRFFNRLMLLIDMFYNILQKKITTVVPVMQHLLMVYHTVSDIREELTHMPFEDLIHILL
jgi:hypothetical protein